MKISQVYCDGAITSQSVFSGEFLEIDYGKLNGKNPNSGIKRILKLNRKDFNVISERVRIRDFTIQNNLDFDGGIFEPDKNCKEFANPLDYCIAEINLGKIRWIVKIAFFPSKKSSQDLMDPDCDCVLDWQIERKMIGVPVDIISNLEKIYHSS